MPKRFLTTTVALAVAFVVCAGARAAQVALHEIDPGTTSPTGQSRWLDVADQAYGPSYRAAYHYNQASVTVTYNVTGGVLRGVVAASNLKPNFAYQLKLLGAAGAPGNEGIGFTGRWWEQTWTGSAWTAGWNLNNKGDGSSPNPNDVLYLQRRDVPDDTSPTSLHYLYTAYLVLDYFVTDDLGNASVEFAADSSYHVLWKTTQRTRSASDGPTRERSFDADPALHPAYGADYPAQSVTIFGEWERLPVGGVRLPLGAYECQFILTEESFHGSGGSYAGNWAAAMGGDAAFTVAEDATLSVSSAPVSGVQIASTTGHGGSAPYQQALHQGTSISLSAPPAAIVGETDFPFVRWSGAPQDAVFSDDGRTVSFTLFADAALTAEYEILTWPLSVSSIPADGVFITSPTGHGGDTNYRLVLDDNTPVVLAAPEAAGDRYFQRWDDGGGATFSHTAAISFTLNAEAALTAVYGDLQVEAPSAEGATIEWSSTYVIRWRSSLSSRARVKIELCDAQGTRWLLAPSVVNRGQWRWRVGEWESKSPPRYPLGEGYRICISTLSDIVNDYSDYPFSIGQVDGLEIRGETIAAPAPSEVRMGESVRFTCRGNFSPGDAQDLSAAAEWRVTDARGKPVKGVRISGTGLLTAAAIPADQPCRVRTAYHAKGRGTLTAETTVIVTGASSRAE